MTLKSLYVAVLTLSREDLDILRAQAETKGRDFPSYVAAIALGLGEEHLDQVTRDQRNAVKSALFLYPVREQARHLAQEATRKGFH